MRDLLDDCTSGEGSEKGSYVAVVALVCALCDFSRQSECRGTGGQAEDVVEGLHGDEILSDCCGVGGSSGVLVGFADVRVVSIYSAFARIFIPVVRLHSHTV